MSDTQVVEVEVDSADVNSLTKLWWIWVVSGAAWMIFAFIVLSFTWATVLAVGIMAGAGFFLAGVSEVIIGFASDSWKWLRFTLGAIGIVLGGLMMFWPGVTFLVLLRLVALYLILRGTMEIIAALMFKDETDLWWLELIIGIMLVAVGFWAIQYRVRELYILVIWIGIGSIAKSIGDFVVAFQLRKLHKEVA